MFSVWNLLSRIGDLDFLQTLLNFDVILFVLFSFYLAKMSLFQKGERKKNLCLVLSFNLKFNYRVNQNYLFIPSNGFFSFFLFKSFVYLFLSNFKILYWHIVDLQRCNSFRYTEKHILGSKGSDLSMCPLMKTV